MRVHVHVRVRVRVRVRRTMAWWFVSHKRREVLPLVCAGFVFVSHQWLVVVCFVVL